MENITQDKEKGQSIETASEMTQMIKLVENDMNTIIRIYSIGSRCQRWDQALNMVHTHPRWTSRDETTICEMENALDEVNNGWNTAGKISDFKGGAIEIIQNETLKERLARNETE